MIEKLGIKLEDLYFGMTDGALEAKKDNFEELFLNNNNTVEKFIDSSKFVISGRKGTGKTILANSIEKKLNDIGWTSSFHDLEDLKERKLIEFRTLELNESQLKLFWKWTFLFRIGENILKSSKKSRFFKSKIENRIAQIIESTDDISNFITQEISSATSDILEAKASVDLSKGIATNLKAKSNNKQTNGMIRKSYYDKIGELESLLQSYFETQKNKNTKIVLFYDDLDELENKINAKQHFNRVIISMLESAKHINLKFGVDRCRIILILRSDIIESVHEFSSNTNKWLPEMSEKLTWHKYPERNPIRHPLMKMVLLKIKSSDSRLKEVTDEELFSSIFPDDINGKDVLKYLIHHSFGRPRDITAYLNKVKDCFPTVSELNATYIKSSEADYSKWFYTELINEISIYETKDQIICTLELISDFAKTIFKYEDLEAYLEENRNQYNDINLKTTIPLLYSLGVIGNMWYIKRKRYNNRQVAFAYREDSNPHVDLKKKLIVHSALLKEMKLK